MISRGSKIIIKELKDRGFEAYIVGGAIRDHLLGINNFDYDITTNATPEDIMNLPFETVVSGGIHGTITVKMRKHSYEVTPFRTESGYSDHRHPDKIAFTQNLKEDLKRRDFTINAICYDPIDDVLIDLYGGQDDLKNKILRTIGNPYDRFEEDAFRILRGLRFASCLDMKVDQYTKEAILDKYHNLNCISMERICEEFSKLLVGVRAAKIIDEFREVFEFIIPNFSSFYNENVYHDLLCSKEDITVRLFYLLKDYSDYSDVLLKMRFQNWIVERVSTFIECYNKEVVDNKDVYFIISKVRLEAMEHYIEILIDLNYDEIKLELIKAYYTYVLNNNIPMNISGLDIDGNQLMELGFSGKRIKEVLQRLHELVLFTELKNINKDLIEVAKTYL